MRNQLLKLKVFTRLRRRREERISKKVRDARKVLDMRQNRRRKVLMRWRQAVLARQIRTAQQYTSAYIAKKMLLKRAFTSMKAYKDYRGGEKEDSGRAVVIHQHILKRRAMRGFLKFQQSRLRKAMLIHKILKFREGRMRKCHRFFKNMRAIRRRREAEELAASYYCRNIMNKLLVVLKRNLVVRSGLKDQRRFVL